MQEVTTAPSRAPTRPSTRRTICKRGEHAIIIRSYAGNYGKVVRCLRKATAAEIAALDFVPGPGSGPFWWVDKVVPFAVRLGGKWVPAPHGAPLVADAALCPLRGGVEDQGVNADCTEPAQGHRSALAEVRNLEVSGEHA